VPSGLATKTLSTDQSCQVKVPLQRSHDHTTFHMCKLLLDVNTIASHTVTCFQCSSFVPLRVSHHRYEMETRKLRRIAGGAAQAQLLPLPLPISRFKWPDSYVGTFLYVSGSVPCPAQCFCLTCSQVGLRNKVATCFYAHQAHADHWNMRPVT
jgi:hypothetical protein